jgi:membrane protein YdbS with pleckstrin-like domain
MASNREIEAAPGGEKTPGAEKYCWQCGEALDYAAPYCHYCGANLSRPEKPPPVEQIIFRTGPSFYRVGKSCAAAAAASLAAAAGFGYFGGSFGGVLICSALLFCIPLYRQWQRRRTSYTLSNLRIEIETGIVSRTVQLIPLPSVRNVTTRAPLLKRLFGVGDVLIDSAAAARKINLTDLRRAREFADLILTQLHRLNLTNRER